MRACSLLLVSLLVDVGEAAGEGGRLHWCLSVRLFHALYASYVLNFN